MTSTATEATSSLRRNGELAVRLCSTQQPAAARRGTPVQSQTHADAASRGGPRKPPMPRHPIPSMQEAFAESLAEVTSGTLALKPKLAAENAQTRRAQLIDQDRSEGPPAALWRYRPGQNCHELRKLIAQIAFGVYLLLKGMANSNAQVVAILQGHIDEVDEYLRTAMDDLTLATQDLATRLEHLRLPLSDISAFEEMLEDRSFRLRIVEGNVRIEHILSRTATALLQTTQDIKEGIRSTKDFNAYLASESQGSWHADADVADIYEAMRGNAEGWLNAFSDMEEKSNTLDVLISKLSDMVTKMDRSAGEVSRRTRFSIQPFTLPEHDKQASRISQTSEGSQESSNASSHETTPPASPGVHVPQSPPRLSLRLSILDSSLTSDFLDLGSRSSFFGGDSSFLTWTPASDSAEADGKAAVRTEKPDDQRHQEPAIMVDAGQDVKLDNRRYSPGAGEGGGGDEEIGTGATDTQEQDADDDNLIPLRIDIESPNPVVVETLVEATSNRSHVDEEEEEQEEEEEKEEEAEEAPLYLLQPRTYTPQPPAPLPSPMVREHERSSYLAASPAQPQRQSGAGERSPRLAGRPRQEPPSYRAPSPAVQGQAKAVHLRTVSGRFRDTDRPIAERQSYKPPPQSHSESSVNTAKADGAQPRKRASLRERVSLRTTPPEAIQVPAPNAPPLQRPVFASPRTYQNYTTFTGPDSANSIETSRTAGPAYADKSHTNNGANTTDFSPPVFPGIIPSPHSDQQYFRPVQASPHSPLQQRPHTAGQVPSRPHHLRNAPSSMGMSMLSSVTTMTQDSETGRTIKKKRSAFGWLKKAFTLDEDERAEFDQRKKLAQQNAYHDPKGPKFLDGRRIR